MVGDTGARPTSVASSNRAARGVHFSSMGEVGVSEADLIIRMKQRPDRKAHFLWMSSPGQDPCAHLLKSEHRRSSTDAPSSGRGAP